MGKYKKILFSKNLLLKKIDFLFKVWFYISNIRYTII